MQNHQSSSKPDKNKGGDLKLNAEAMAKGQRGAIPHQGSNPASPYNESLQTPGGNGQSAFVSRDRAQGGIFQNNAIKQTNGSLDMVSPRNAIGGISGAINN